MPDDPLAGAKATLNSANKFQNSTGGPISKSAPAAAPATAAKAKSPSLGDELAAKEANVSSYRKAYIENYKARNTQ